MVLQMLSMTFWTYFLYCAYNAKYIVQQIEKLVLHFYKKIQ